MEPNASYADEGALEEACGVPTYTFEIEDEVVAEAVQDLGLLLVTYTLSVSAALEVKTTEAVELPFFDHESFAQMAADAVNGLLGGIEVEGLLTDEPSIKTGWGDDIASFSVAYEPPSTLVYEGESEIEHELDAVIVTVSMTGTLGFALRITFTPLPPPVPRPEPVEVEEPSWYEELGEWVEDTASDAWEWTKDNGEAIAVGVAAATLVTVAVVAAPETGGGSLGLLRFVPAL